MTPYVCTCSCSSLLHVFLTLGGLEGLEDSRFWLKVWVQAYFNSLCMLLLCFCRYVLRSSRRGLGIRIEYARQTMGALSVCLCVCVCVCVCVCSYDIVLCIIFCMMQSPLCVRNTKMSHPLQFHRSPTGSLRSTSTPHSDSSSTYSS